MLKPMLKEEEVEVKIETIKNTLTGVWKQLLEETSASGRRTFGVGSWSFHFSVAPVDRRGSNNPLRAASGLLSQNDRSWSFCMVWRPHWNDNDDYFQGSDLHINVYVAECSVRCECPESACLGVKAELWVKAEQMWICSFMIV